MFWNFWIWKIRSFSSQKVDGNMIFIDYRNGLFFNVSEIGNTDFLAKKLMERYWLLKSCCFELFGGGKYGLFLNQKVDGKMIFTDYWKVFVLNFSLMGNKVFQPKSWWKDYIFLVFLSFPWYSKTWEIRFFVQCFRASNIGIKHIPFFNSLGKKEFSKHSWLFRYTEECLLSSSLHALCSDWV